jgi:hypothetical protein
MNTKLTLTIQHDVIRKAKAYAKQKNRSLSDIIENYLKSITTDDPDNEMPKLTPIVRSLKGSFKAPANFDEKEALAEALQKKHL